MKAIEDTYEKKRDAETLVALSSYARVSKQNIIDLANYINPDILGFFLRSSPYSLFSYNPTSAEIIPHIIRHLESSLEMSQILPSGRDVRSFAACKIRGATGIFKKILKITNPMHWLEIKSLPAPINHDYTFRFENNRDATKFLEKLTQCINDLCRKLWRIKERFEMKAIF